ncbi:hypothetical protein D3C84_677730 [compost metagenome]
MGGDDQHPRHDPRAGRHATRPIEAEQFDQGQACHQGTAHVGHAKQGSGTLVRQGVNRLHWRHFHQAAGGQAQPFFAKTKHQQRAGFHLALGHCRDLPSIFLLQRIAVEQARRGG